jgi:rRNA maturation RNase YbeY
MVEIFVQSRYKVKRKFLKTEADRLMVKMGIRAEEYVLSIAIVGDRKMSEIHKKYMKKDGTTPVLAFPLLPSSKRYKIINPTEKISNQEGFLLGEIVISYPQTVIFASEENKLLDKKLVDFIEHGLLQLIGVGR